jgi:hypothetical protein
VQVAIGDLNAPAKRDGVCGWSGGEAHADRVEMLEGIAPDARFLRGVAAVARDELPAAYDGYEKQGTQDWTWFTRFFDYL